MNDSSIPARRFYPYLCENSKYLVFGGDAVQGIRTFGDATRLLMNKFRDDFGGNLCPSMRDLLKNPMLLQSGIAATATNLAQHGLNPDAEISRTVVRDGFIDSSFFHHWQHYRWHWNGRTIYNVHPELARAFIETELTVAPHVLRIDYPTVYLGLLDLGLTVWHQTTGEHPLNGMYISIDVRDDEPWIFVVVVGEAHPGTCDDDNSLCSFSLPLDGETDIEELVRKIDANPTRQQLLGPNAKRFVAWARLAVNALLYIQHVAEDSVHLEDYGVPASKLAHAEKIKSKKQREAFLQKYRAPVRYVQLGEAFAKSGMSGSDDDGSERAVVRHLVRGHWRWQVFGKGRLSRKLLWIKPHWRGSEDMSSQVSQKTTKIVNVKKFE